MKVPSRTLSFTMCSLLVAVMMAAPLQALISYALNRENTHASQIVLIPFISAALIYINRKNIFRSVHYSVMPAMLLLIPGFLFMIAGKTAGAQMEEGDHLALMAASMVFLWLGCFLMFYGSTAFRTAIFPLLFLGFFI